MTKRTYQWSTDWGLWDEFTQYRRPTPMHVDIRRSLPAALLLGSVGVLAALYLAVIGLPLPRQGLTTCTLVTAASLAVFLLGRGVVIDGNEQIVRQWWGWLYWPVCWRPVSFSTIQAIEISKKLGAKSPDPTVGRTVHYPVLLLRGATRAIVVKNCPWVSEARFLAEELSQLMSVPVTDESGEPLDVDETEY